MKFNWLNTETNRQSRQRGTGFDYQPFEPKNLLAGDLGFGNQALLIDQLADRQDTAWTQQGLNDLVEVDSLTDQDGTTTVFQQTWNGLPVFNSWVTVVQDSEGEITNVRDHARQNIQGYARDIDPLGEQSAIKIGSQGIDGVSASDTEASLAWFYTGNKARLSWLVESTVVDPSGEVTGEFETWINVFDGSLFHREAKGETVSEVLADPITETGIFPRIVINDAVGAGGSRLHGAIFNSVAFMDVGCTGTLIAPNAVVSARHCGDITQVTFGDSLFGLTNSYGVESVTFPGGGNAGSPLLNGGDVAILVLAEDVPASVATPVRFIDATTELEGIVATTVGYGLNGVGSVGHEGSQDFTRWAGENIIDVFGSPAAATGSNIFSTDFDDGSNDANTIDGSDPVPLVLEATTAPGDSGGPLLVEIDGEFVIAGVLSGGTTATSVYGDISWWTGTSEYRDQLEDVGGEFISSRSAEGNVTFDRGTYFVGDSVDITVRDGNVAGDTVTVTVASDSGDSETLTLPSTFDGRFELTINTSEDAVAIDDGVLQVSAGDAIAILYVDVDDGTGNQENRTDSAEVIAVPPPIIGVDFDAADNAPTDWISLSSTGTFSDLQNEFGLDTVVDLTVTGSSVAGFAFDLDATTVPQYFNALNGVDGQIFTNANPVSFTYSDLDPSVDYDLYVLSAEGFFASIEQTVTIQGEGSPISFEQRFDMFDLFINDQVGDVARDFTDYAISLRPDSNGVITVNIDPIAGTADVVVAGLGLFAPQTEIVAAPNIVLNNTEIERSIVDEVVVSFDDIVTVGADAFELIHRDSGGVVDVIPVIDNSSGSTVVTLTFSGALATQQGSLVDGNYQLTVFGDEVLSSSGNALDGDSDGIAGGNLVFGDTEADNFFRFFGDIDGDRTVNVFDLLGFRQAFRSSDGDAAFESQFDHNGDGTINTFDLLPFRNNYIDTLEFV